VTRFLRAHKLLVVVYSGLLFLAIREWTDPEINDDQKLVPADYLESGRNIADVSAAIHPERAVSFYYRAHQAVLCSQPGAEQYEVCRSRGPAKPEEVRELLERALATGNRSLEEALYNYAWVLVQENAPEAEIDAAVALWRENHPDADRPDPRTLRPRQAPSPQRASR
jgi:hypothetical protein